MHCRHGIDKTLIAQIRTNKEQTSTIAAEARKAHVRALPLIRLMSVYAQQGNVEKVLEVMATMDNKIDMIPNKTAYLIVIDMYSKLDKVGDMEAWYEKMLVTGMGIDP